MRSDKHAPAACTGLAAVPAVLGRKHDSRIARRRDTTGPNTREPRGSGGVPGGGRPPDLARPSLHDTLAAQNKDTSLLPEQPLQLTTLVEYAPSTVSVRDEQATAATRHDWYRADPRAYIRIAAVLRERITAGELVPGRATPSIGRLCADHGAWPARPQLTPCMSFRMAGSYTRSPDWATTSAMTSFRSVAPRGGRLPDREPGSEEASPLGTALCPLLSTRGGCRPECITS